MALTRKMLKAMGIEDEKIEQIVEAHAETVDALKGERDQAVAEAGEAVKLREQLDEARADLEAASRDGFKAKYEEEHAAFEAFKSDVEQERAESAKSALYRELLREAGVDEKRVDSVLRVADLSAVEVRDGEIVDRDKALEGVKSEWSDFIATTGSHGGDVETPPAGGGEVDLDGLSDAEYYKQVYGK